MKKFAWIIASVLIVLLVGSKGGAAVGSSFGFLSTARTSPIGAGQAGLGVGLGLGDDHRNSISGLLNYGLFDYIDGTARLGFSDADKVRLAIGAEMKYQFLDAGSDLKDPLDAAAGAFFEHLDEVTQVGVFIAASQSYPLGSVQLLSPYGRFNVRMESYGGDSKIEVGFHAGVRWGVTENISLFGELQIDGNNCLVIGLRDWVF